MPAAPRCLSRRRGRATVSSGVPELPDIEAYRAALERRALGQPLERVRLRSFFLLRTVEPPLSAFEGRVLSGTRRLGKRLVLSFDGAGDRLFLVLHLMLAGRLAWAAPVSALPGKHGLAGLDFTTGTLLVTEAGSKRMASLHAVDGEAALAEMDPGGQELADIDAAEFARALRAERHTLKWALTAPRILSGIGGAYADEILHEARLSPVSLTTSLSDAELGRLFDAAKAVLGRWTRHYLDEVERGRWPKIGAFQAGMAVHGRYGQPCPRCGDPVQKIQYANRQTNYCATCQTDGVVLADRLLSRLLGDDWPRTLEAWDARIGSSGREG